MTALLVCCAESVCSRPRGIFWHGLCRGVGRRGIGGSVGRFTEHLLYQVGPKAKHPTLAPPLAAPSSVAAAPTVTPTMTMNPTPTRTPNSTPTPTPNWVYVYQSCEPISVSGPVTQVIQTVKANNLTDGLIFQDQNGLCWTYLGRYETNYIAPSTVSAITYSGNYFGSLFLGSDNAYQFCVNCSAVRSQGIQWFGNYNPTATSAQNACLSYSNNRSYYTNTIALGVGTRVYDTYTSVPTNGNNKWVVLKANSLNAGIAVQIDTSGYITSLQNVNTNSC